MSDFLAEARIIVRPDTTAFRAELEAQLRAATAKPITIPVVAAVAPASVAGAAAAAAGQQSVAAAAQEAGAASQAAAASTVRLSTAQNAAAVAAQKLAFAQSEVVGASSAASAAHVTLTRSTAAVAAAQAAVGVALRANDAAMIASTKDTLALAAAQELEAKSSLTAARSQAAHAGSLSQLGRGAGASGLSLFGLRGATLAASGAFLAGTAAVVAFSKAVQAAAQLQTELNVFRVAAGATADEMKRASEEATALGRDLTLPGVTAGDAAEAMTQLAKAGLSVRDSLDATRGTLQLATAAQIDNVAATNLVASSLNSFGLAGGEAVRVADLLTGAAKESQGEITDMGTALQQASAVAKLAGINLEDTVTFLTELARAGISGGRAGTSLRVAFLRLINPTAGAAAELEKLNVQLRDSQGRVRSQVFTDIAAALENMTKAQQQATLATIFGTDAVRAAAIIGSQGATSFRQLRDSITEAGLAQEQAAARTQGFQGSVENLKNQFEGLGASVGKFVIGPGKVLADFFATTVSDANALIGLLGDLNSKFAELSGKADAALGISPSTSEKIRDTLLTGIKNSTRIGPVVIEMAIDSTKLKRDAKQVRSDIESIVSAGQKTGGDLGLNQTLVNLDLLVEKLKEGGPSAQQFADGVKKVRDRLFEAQGFKLFPDNIRDMFPPELLPESERILREAGEKGGKSFKDAMMQNAIPGNLTPEVFVGFTNAVVGAAVSAADKVRSVMAGIVRDATQQLSGLDEAFDVAVAAGSNKTQLSVLRQQQAEQQRIRDAADKASQQIGAGNKGFATAVKTRREAQQQLASINTQIRGIEGQIASDAKQTASEAQSRADEAQKARDDADRAFLEEIGFKESGLQNRILTAGTTKALSNDIARNKALRDFYTRSREEAGKTIVDASLRLKTIQSFTRDIIQITKTITDLQKQQDDDADRAFLGAIGFKEGGLQNNLLAAAATKTLANDIARNKSLRDFYKKSREEAGKTIIDAKLRLQTIQSFTRDIIQVTQTITDLQAQQAEAEKAAREKRNQTIEESLQFDISFASTKQNKSGEITAREKLITQLKKEQALVKRGTNEWKKLRNEIAEEQKAIADLRGVTKQKDSSFFEFLQTQQGFASNLLGNLIPSGATSGLVGGSSVQGALTPVASAADGRSQSGPTAGQAQSTNATLLRILDQLKILNGGNAAPEAQRQHRFQGALMDGVGGG